jgi:hypothetical protein
MREVIQGTGRHDETTFGDDHAVDVGADGRLYRTRTHKNGNGLLENSDVFAFAGQLVPAKVRYSVGGVLKIEITQTMTELTDATANVLEAPPNAQVLSGCTTFRRAFGQIMPQPKSGGGGGVSNVLLRGVIGTKAEFKTPLSKVPTAPTLAPKSLQLCSSGYSRQPCATATPSRLAPVLCSIFREGEPSNSRGATT